MFNKVLIANRGAIACRIERTLKRMGVGSVAVYSAADKNSLHVLNADEAVFIGEAPAAQSYLSFDAIFAAAEKTGAEAIHPGYGFLSENIAFARACAARGIVFIGPAPEHIDAFALKHTARATALSCGVPLLPGTGLLTDLDDALAKAESLAYPVMLKSSGGGGGIGMRVCESAAQLAEVYESVLRLSKANFGDSGVYLEKYVARARHIEVQIFGDGRGNVLALGERDCSAQRRHQKVLEETPAPGLTDAVRERLKSSAIRLGEGGELRVVGHGRVHLRRRFPTVLLPGSEHASPGGARRHRRGHGLRSGRVDDPFRPPARWLRSAASTSLPAVPRLKLASTRKTPPTTSSPTPGKLTQVAFPGADVARVETWIESGTIVTSFYDPMIAKIIVHGADREEALRKMSIALTETSIDGSRRIFATCGRCSRRRNLCRARLRLRSSGPSRTGGMPLKSSTGELSPRSRTSPAASVIGTSACRRPVRWTRFQPALQTGSSAIPTPPVSSNSPPWARVSASTPTR